VNGPIKRSVSFEYPWGDALSAWRKAAPDLAIVNLETAVTRSEGYVPKGINYRMSPENLGCLRAAGIDACVLANNHTLDWGQRGLSDTLGALGAAKIRVAGAGPDLASARAPAILETKAGPRALLISCAVADSGIPPNWAAREDRAGVNLITLSDDEVDAIARNLDAVRRRGDIAIVSIHWGPNWGYAIDAGQRKFAADLIQRAGVSIVHGHSSHHPKGVEVFQGRLILYGCGDFLNDYEGIEGYETFRGDLVAAYLASIDPANGQLCALEILPFQIHRFRLRRPAGDDIAWFRQRLDRECRELGACIGQGPAGRLRLRWRDQSSEAAVGAAPVDRDQGAAP
jgi:poly-gamma-glutamate synthesis protein (capsule biosynthesis protein)